MACAAERLWNARVQSAAIEKIFGGCGICDCRPARRSDPQSIAMDG
jgi:hypothetical protein